MGTEVGLSDSRVALAFTLGRGLGFLEVVGDSRAGDRGNLGLGIGLAELPGTVPRVGCRSLSCFLGGKTRGFSGMGRFMYTVARSSTENLGDGLPLFVGAVGGLCASGKSSCERIEPIVSQLM